MSLNSLAGATGLHGRVVAMCVTICKVEIPRAGNVQTPVINVEAINRPTVQLLRLEPMKLNRMFGSLSNIFNARIVELIYLGDHVSTRISAAAVMTS
ncbi:hypothetical protein H8B02_43645 [Bradyrhizobium sp. Pear77]|uniref:hypothetical protein n=1 Tax=Bradyrhizobium altum TaxID=1571202 RepID=UPI001E4D5771|nr:hypothetical protein [Bradyrhizobium altum]MCC8960058.1 hypothetical protein [Bradyrhizobium altum]